MEIALYIVLGTVVFFTMLFLYFYSSYNRVVALDERCNTAFSDIDVLMKHRHTLLPGLLDTVKGYIEREKEIFERLMDSRDKALQAVTASAEVKLEAEARLGQNIMQIINSAQQNPDLKTNEHFIHFREQLIDVENRITASRRFYNTTVEEMNATVRQFPAKVFAKKARVEKRDHYSLGTEKMLVDEPVNIKF